MPVAKCPHCHQRFAFTKHDSDYVHACNSGNETLDNEDHFNIATNPLIGLTNTLQGTSAGIRGEKRLTKTTRGNNVLTHTTRQRYIHIDLKTMNYSENPTS